MSTYHMGSEKTFILYIEEISPSIPITPDKIDDSQPWMQVEPLEPD